MNWNLGYVSEISYTHGYYPELGFTRHKLALLNSGVVANNFFSACELGFGQGLSANIHAASTDVACYGTDFNPSQAAFAQEVAQASHAGARLYDDSFVDFVQRADLPDFDFIALHGIWSWISDENRHVIVEFIRRKLKVGGVLYISYNTMPGWASFAPIRKLMMHHAELIGSKGKGIVRKIDDAIEFTDKLFATNPMFSLTNPQAKERLEKLREMSRHYLAHEYFNRDWHPMHFSDIAEWLEPAKVQFACSATYLEHVPSINFSPEQLSFLNEIPDRMFRETVKDFMINQQFRKDYWVKGRREISLAEKMELIGAERVILGVDQADLQKTVRGALGEANLNAAVYDPIIDVLSSFKVKCLRQIQQEVAAKGINSTQIIEAIMVLIGSGFVSPAQDDAVASKAKKTSDLLNDHLIQLSKFSNDIGFLASPVTGGGIGVGRFQQLFIQAIHDGKKQPHDLAMHVWGILKAQGQSIIKDRKTLQTEDENLTELNTQAETFINKHVSLLKSLQIIQDQ